jgi:hypothetical protein
VCQHHISPGISTSSTEACRLRANCASVKEHLGIMVSACTRIMRDTQPNLKQEGPCPSYITHPGIRASYSHALNYIYSEQQISMKFWPRQQRAEKQPPLLYLSGDAMSRQSNDLHTSLSFSSTAAREKGRVHCSETTKSAESCIEVPLPSEMLSVMC